MGVFFSRERPTPAATNPPAKRTRPRYQRMFPVYECISLPRYSQLLYAMYIWDKIAVAEGLQYSFVGSIAARISCDDDDFQIKELEILVDPSARASHSKALTEIMHKYYNLLTITPSGQQIIYIEENQGIGWGIAIQFFETGSDDYPDAFIPPPDSPFRDVQHIGLTPTYTGRLLRLQPPHNRYVPVLRFHLLLQQRLRRFDPDSRDTAVVEQNRSDVIDIKTFLEGAYTNNEPPFAPATAQVLLPIVRIWIKYTRVYFFNQITVQEVEWWRRMNIALTNDDVAGLIFPTGII